jgi:hypothetical protein
MHDVEIGAMGILTQVGVHRAGMSIRSSEYYRTFTYCLR